MSPWLALFIALPLLVPASVGIAIGAGNPGVRAFALLIALLAVGVIAFVFGQGFGLSGAVDLCSDSAGSYFTQYGRFAPFCLEVP